MTFNTLWDYDAEKPEETRSREDTDRAGQEQTRSSEDCGWAPKEKSYVSDAQGKPKRRS